MMILARNPLVSVTNTSYYHCISRCVRHTFLNNKNKFTDKSYQHKREWVEDKLQFLSRIFAINICAYAIMNNHTHLVLYIDTDSANTWSDKEVVRRWLQLFKGSLLIQQYSKGKTIPEHLKTILNKTIAEYRQHLIDIKWFMRILNDGIAQQANKKDNSIAHFWEGNFNIHALPNEATIIACMAYVDLIPVKATSHLKWEAKTPETSNFTSIKKRIKQALQNKQPDNLQPFVEHPSENIAKGLPFAFNEYIELIELTSRCIKEGKSDYIESTKSPILERLNITAENWLSLSKNLAHIFEHANSESANIPNFLQNARFQWELKTI